VTRAGGTRAGRSRAGDSAPDAIVVGAGPNGLVAANLLVDAGWEVVVLEALGEPGGAVKSARLFERDHPEFTSDLCSAFYPLAAASPEIAGLHLEEHGLRWQHADAVLAHPLADGRAAVLERRPEATIELLEQLAPGDGAGFQRLYDLWKGIGDEILEVIFTPFPPLRAASRIASTLKVAGTLRLLRLLSLPVRRLGEEEFSGPGAMLLAGCAMHADLSPEQAGSSIYGWLLTMLGQQFGFPVPAGGAGELTKALVARFESLGGSIVCNAEVDEIVVRDGRAVGVRVRGDMKPWPVRRAVLADVPATCLYQSMVAAEHLPARLTDDLKRFQWDYATVKVDWALSRPVPWAAEGPERAGTVHLASSMDQLTEYSAQLAMGRVPGEPFVLVGQMTTADPTRSPPGTESLWAYTHVPRSVRGDAGSDDITGCWDDRELEAMADRITAQFERYAPSFGQAVVDRHVMGPAQLEEHDLSLVGGAINGGTSAIHQQLVFRPTPGLGRPETPIVGLYLASSSAHPGGGVHGACGANAARAALREVRPVLGPLARSVVRFAERIVNS
jgi:phytoene dehydrogenase-like protein